MTTVAKLKGNEAVEVVTAGLPNKEQNVPCDQCTDPARCENFGVCQIFKHTLPAGSYEQRIKELAPELGMPRARVGDRLCVHVQHPSPRTITMILATPESAAYANELLADPSSGWKLSGAAPSPCKPGTRCSRSIRGLGGCEAGSCEREEGAGGVKGRKP